jgi:hypothetical protein
MIKTKIKQYLSWQRVFAFLLLSFLVGLSITHRTIAQTFSQGYGSDKPLQRGMLVKLKKSDTTKVEAATLETADQTYGVTISANDASVTLSSDGQQYYVTTNGHYDVLVTSQNGSIGAGDYVTVSSIEGMGMKAGTTEPVIIGRALEAFDGKTNIVSTAEIEDSSKHKQTVNISRIKVDIGVAKNPLLKATQTNVPEFLRSATTALAGKPVSATRIYTGIFVFMASTIVAGSLMYSGIRNGVISIGRNPLSKKSIVKIMLQVIVTGLIVFIAGLFGVYLLLKI